MCIHVRISVFQLGQMQAGKFCPKNPASQHIFIKKKEKGKKKNTIWEVHPTVRCLCGKKKPNFAESWQ